MEEKLDTMIQVHHLNREILYCVSGRGKLLLVSAQHGSVHIDNRTDGSFLPWVHVGKMILLCEEDDPEAKKRFKQNLLTVQIKSNIGRLPSAVLFGACSWFSHTNKRNTNLAKAR